MRIGDIILRLYAYFARARYNTKEVDVKKIFRRGGLYVLGTALLFCLIGLAYFSVFARITSNPTEVKQILNDSGVYKKIPQVIYDDAVQSEATTSTTLPLQDPGVRQAALDTFDAGFAQKSIESVLDGTFAWLEGNIPQPQFEVNVKEAKDKFAAAVSEQAAQRAAGLPVCTAAQLREVNASNLLTAKCRPPGVSIDSLKTQLQNEVAAGDEFLKDNQVTPETFKDQNNQSIFVNRPDIPQTFQFFKSLPYILGLLVPIIAVGIVFLSYSKREGLFRLVKLFAIAGLFALFTPLAMSILANMLFGSAGNNVAAELAGPVVKSFNAAAAGIYYFIGGVYLVLAGSLFLLREKLFAEPPEEQTK